MVRIETNTAHYTGQELYFDTCFGQCTGRACVRSNKRGSGVVH